MKILEITFVGLRRLFRDRTGLFFVLVFPVIITILVGFAVFKTIGTSLPVGIIDRSNSTLSKALVADLNASDATDLETFNSRERLEDAIRRDEIQAGVIIPADYEEKVERGESVDILFIPSPRASNAQVIQSTVSSSLTTQGAILKAATFASANGGGTFSDNLAIAREQIKQDQGRLGVQSEIVGDAPERQFSGFNYPSASNLVLFMFITSMTAAGQLIQTRKLGISRRMLSTPTKPSTILAGLTIGRFVIALFQGLFIFGAGTIMFGVDWGSTIGTMLIILSFALVSTGVAILFGTILKTPEQSGLGVPLGIGLGMLGGCMWPLEIVSQNMRTIGHLTPHAWAMDGFIALIGKGLGPADIIMNVLVLLGFATFFFVVSIKSFRRQLTQ